MWWVGGGFHPNNQATSWPNLHAQDKQDFNSSWNCKLGPSVAIVVLPSRLTLLFTSSKYNLKWFTSFLGILFTTILRCIGVVVIRDNANSVQLNLTIRFDLSTSFLKTSFVPNWLVQAISLLWVWASGVNGKGVGRNNQTLNTKILWVQIKWNP